MPRTHKLAIWDTNVVAMARHGLISNNNEATGSAKVFKYLPGLRGTISISKKPAKVSNKKYESYFLYGVGGMGAALLFKNIDLNQVG